MIIALALYRGQSVCVFVKCGEYYNFLIKITKVLKISPKNNFESDIILLNGKL